MDINILSYKDWLKSIDPNTLGGDPYSEYLEYVSEWYTDRYAGSTTAELTKEEYKNFLSTMSVVVSDTDVSAYLANIDYESDADLKASIPYFVQNLKEIARGISIRRTIGKYTNAIYKVLDSNEGLEDAVYRTLLNAHAINSELEGDDFLDVVGGVSVDVEELYDDLEYLDKDPSNTGTDYFDIAGNIAIYGTNAEFLNWVVSSGFNALVSDNDAINPSISGDLALSGYMDYDSGETVEHFKGQLGETLMGEDHYMLSGTDVISYSDAKKPWSNISNRYFPTIASVELLDMIYTASDSGGYYIPSKIGLPIALGLNKDSVYDSTIGTKDNFPSMTTYSNGYSYSEEYQFSPIVFRSYLNWIDINASSGRAKGIVANTRLYQEMVPYKTKYENTGFPFMGMARLNDKIDPWGGIEDTVWTDEVDYPPDFRQIYDIDEWYTDHINISGSEDQWAVDIYGNNYGAYRATELDSFYDRTSTSGVELYIRDTAGVTKTFVSYFTGQLDSLLAEFDITTLSSVNVYADNIVLENAVGDLAAMIIDFDTTYTIPSYKSAVISSVSGDTGYSPAGHFYDDRTETLYVCRYKLDAGVVNLILYAYADGNFVELYNMTDDISDDVTALRANYSFNSVVPAPTITVSPELDKLFITYIGDISASGAHTVNIPLKLIGGYESDEIVITTPTVTSTSGTATTEDRYLLNTAVSDSNILLMTEGVTTLNRYIQCIPLD